MEREYGFAGGVLAFNIDTAEISPDEFESALANAVHWSKSDLTVDIRLTGYIASSTIGMLFDAAISCRERGRRLKVIAGPAVARMLERTGFAGIGDLKTVEP